MASVSVPPQEKAALLLTRFYQSRCSVTLACFLENAYIKIGTIQRRLAWPLRKDDTKIREKFQFFSGLKRQCSRTFAMLLICGWGVSWTSCLLAQVRSSQGLLQ